MDGKHVHLAHPPLTQMNQEGRKSVPDTAPVDFVPHKWVGAVTKEGEVNKHAWEFALGTQELLTIPVATQESHKAAPKERVAKSSTRSGLGVCVWVPLCSPSKIPTKEGQGGTRIVRSSVKNTTYRYSIR